MLLKRKDAVIIINTVLESFALRLSSLGMCGIHGRGGALKSFTDCQMGHTGFDQK